MTEFWEVRRPKTKPKTTVWLVIACVILGLWTLFAAAGVVNHPNTSGLGGQYSGIDPFADTSYLAGQLAAAALIPIVVVWAALFFLVVRRTAPERGPAHFAIMALVGLIVGFSPFALHKSGPADDPVQIGIANREISAAMLALLDPEGKTKVDPTIKSTGEAGELERVAKGMIVALQADHDQYLKELEALGFPKFLTGRRLAADPSLKKTRAALEEAAILVAKYRSLNMRRVEEFKAAVRASSLSAAHKAQVISSFESSLASAGPDGARAWDLDAQCVAEYQAAITDLGKARGRWRPSGDRVLFYNNNDLAIFNQHIENIRAMGREGEQLKRQARDQVRAATPQ